MGTLVLFLFLNQVLNNFFDVINICDVVDVYDFVNVQKINRVLVRCVFFKMLNNFFDLVFIRDVVDV